MFHKIAAAVPSSSHTSSSPHLPACCMKIPSYRTSILCPMGSILKYGRWVWHLFSPYPQAISLLVYKSANEGCNGPYLVLSPLSVVRNWESELTRYMKDDIRHAVVVGMVVYGYGIHRFQCCIHLTCIWLPTVQ